MFTSFSTALSGLNAASTGIDIVGNNLANLDTTGFKGSSASFHDMVTETLGGGYGAAQAGFGVGPVLSIRQFTQGSVQNSSGLLDAAIQGDGFFVVHDTSSGATQYTRAGDFHLDASGFLTTSTGQHVQGWTANNGAVTAGGAVGDIQVSPGQLSPPTATTKMSLNMNLDAGAVAGQTNGTFSAPVQVIDSLGNPLVLTVTFTKTDKPLEWNYQVSIPGDATTAGKAGEPTNLLDTPGTMTFDAGGNLTAPAAADGAVPITIKGLADKAADLSINWNLYDSTGQPTVTQFAQASALSGNTQDGSTPAQLTHVGLGDGGAVLAEYSNGTKKLVGQLAMASVLNPDSLTAVGDNNYELSSLSALPVIGAANTAGRGQIVANSLEGSTVDMATEFTKLIQFQRAYQANGKVVTTVDQLSQDTLSLKQ